MNKLTIQINNLEALERLIGGDSEVEVDIRNSVVQKFAEKHLKAVANSDRINTILNRVAAEINKQVTDKCTKEIATFKTYYSGGAAYDIKLNSQITDVIDTQIKTMVNAHIVTAVTDAVAKWSGEQSIEDRISKRFEHYSNDIINTKVREKIENLKASL